MRVAVFGTGGVGAYFGARLAQVGNEVAFIARGAHLDAIRANGLRVDSVLGDMLVKPALASDSTEGIGAVDVVLLGVKTWQVAGVAPALKPLARAGHARRAAAKRRRDGGPARGGARRAPRRGRRVRRLLLHRRPRARQAHRRDHVHQVRRARWHEVRARGTAARRVHESGCRRLRARRHPRRAVGEADARGAVRRHRRRVARADRRAHQDTRDARAARRGHAGNRRGRAPRKGAKLPPGRVERTLALLDATTPAGTSSLQRDIAAGKPSELDAWTGAVVRLGAKHGVPTPLHSFLYAALLPLERRARGEIGF